MSLMNNVPQVQYMRLKELLTLTHILQHALPQCYFTAEIHMEDALVRFYRVLLLKTCAVQFKLGEGHNVLSTDSLYSL